MRAYNLRPLYKLNRVRFKSNRNKRDADEIDNLEFFKIEVDGCVYALGWYANCSWLGTLSDLEMAGIRVRKGNILIGDRTTLIQDVMIMKKMILIVNY